MVIIYKGEEMHSPQIKKHHGENVYLGTLTFRWDPLDVEQRSILAKAVAFAKRQQEKTLLGISHQNYAGIL